MPSFRPMQAWIACFGSCASYASLGWQCWTGQCATSAVDPNAAPQPPNEVTLRAALIAQMCCAWCRLLCVMPWTPPCQLWMPGSALWCACATVWMMAALAPWRTSASTSRCVHGQACASHPLYASPGGVLRYLAGGLASDSLYALSTLWKGSRQKNSCSRASFSFRQAGGFCKACMSLGEDGTAGCVSGMHQE